MSAMPSFAGPGLLTLLGAATIAPAAAHESFSAGQPGNPGQSAREIVVVMDEMDYSPPSIEVRRGEQIRFVIRNAGKLTHEFMLASTADNLRHAEAMKKMPGMVHHDPNGVTLQPGQSAELIWKFTRVGTFEYSCLIGNHRESGMTGTVTVKSGDETAGNRHGSSPSRPHHQP